jgi:amino acid transporter
VAEELPAVEVRFSRELSAARAVSRSLAILIAVAVFTLQGSAMIVAGPSAAVSYLLAGVFVSLTLLCYVELLTSSAGEGGAYVLLRETTRGPLAFLTAWAILLGGLLLCALLALGFAACASELVESLSGHVLPETVVAALLIAAMSVYNVVGGRSHRKARDIVTWLTVAILLLLCLLCLPHLRTIHYQPFAPHGYLGIQIGLSLLLIGFLAFESVTLSVAEIPQPRRSIPLIFFAVAGVATLLFVFIALVTGSTLSSDVLEQSRLPLAALAEIWLGGDGVLILLLPLIFIPLALNSTLLLVVRQAQGLEQD